MSFAVVIFILSILGNLSFSTASPMSGTDDPFTINITMHGYDTTKVRTIASVRSIGFLSYLGRRIRLCEIRIAR